MKSVQEFFEFYFKVFSIWGVSVFGRPSARPYVTISLLWIAFLSIVLITIMGVVSYYYEQLLSNTGALSTSIDAFQLFSPIVCHLILIGESVLKVKTHQKMWVLLQRIESLLIETGRHFRKENRRLFSKFSFTFVIWQAIPICVEFYIILTISKAVEWQQNWIARIFSFNAIRMASMQYILWTDYLASRAAIICAEMKCLEEHTQDMQLSPKFDRYLFTKMEQCKMLHRLLWQLSQNLNKRFEFFILTTITNLFLSITVDLYWIYGNFVFGGNPYALRKLLKRK